MSHEMSEGFKIDDGRVTANTLQRKMFAWLEAKRKDPRVAQRPFFEDLSIPSPVQQPLLTGAVDGVPLQIYSGYRSWSRRVHRRNHRLLYRKWNDWRPGDPS